MVTVTNYLFDVQAVCLFGIVKKETLSN